MNIKLITKNECDFDKIRVENFVTYHIVVYMHNENKFEVIKCRDGLAPCGFILNKCQYLALITESLTGFIAKTTESDKKQNREQMYKEFDELAQKYKVSLFLADNNGNLFVTDRL